MQTYSFTNKSQALLLKVKLSFI